MLEVDFNRFCSNLKTYIDEAQGSPLMYEDFLCALLDRNHSKSAVKYPYKIRIAKPLTDLLKGDFEPAYEIEVREPIEYKGKPIWELTSNKGLEAQFGFENSDRRYFSNVGFDDVTPHGTVAGTSGSGKSVFINDMLFSLFYSYAPWELDMYMSDAKIAEFMRYGVTHNIPHIRIIAATEDTSFSVSMLDKIIDDMNKWNAVFGSVGVSNLEDFRKVTGLTVPRKLFVMDEYQYMLQQAGKKSSQVVEKLDVIGRAGRSAGVHMFLASQEVGQEVKGGILKNMNLRCCLRAESDVSELILGNPEASKLAGKGTVIVNTQASKKDILTNRRFQVPFQPKDQFKDQGIFLQEMGKRIGYRPTLHFYNELEPLPLEEIARRSASNPESNSFVIGEPSQMYRDPKRFMIPVDFTDMCNVITLCSSPKDCGIYLHTFLANAFPFNQHKILLADPSMILYDLSAYNPAELKSVDDFIWKGYMSVIYRRKLLLEVEKKIDREGFNVQPECVEYYDELFSEFRNDLNYSRTFYALELLETNATYVEILAGGNSNSDYQARAKQSNVKLMFESIFNLSSDLAKTSMIPSDLPPLFLHIVGLNRVVGLARDAQFREITKFKKLLMDASEGNVMIFCYTTTLEDIVEIRSGIKHIICDKAEMEYNKMKTEIDYPMKVTKVAAVYCDKINKSLYTFKKATI